MTAHDNRPMLTFVIGTFNAAKTLQRTLDSIVSQDCDPGLWEILVSDGASTDGTTDILLSNQHALAWWASERDSGLTEAWNRCLSRARGEWILFLGADDALHDPGTVREAARRLPSSPTGAELAYGRILLAPPEDLSKGTILGSSWESARRRFFLENALPHQAVFHSVRLFEACGRFDESFRFAADYELMLRSVLRTPPQDLGQDFIVTRMADAGMSSDPVNAWKIHEEFRRARQKNGVPGSFGERVLQFRASIKRSLASTLGPRYSRWIGRPFLSRARTRP